MVQTIQLIVTPEQASDSKQYTALAAEYLQISPKKISGVNALKRSIDARSRQVKMNLQLEVFIEEPHIEKSISEPVFRQVENAPEVYIIGAGPAGLFAALRLIELGKKPIIIERGKNVQDRRRDLANITKNHIVNPESNYCFGEGGAGTYSDGKLYTRSDKRGDIKKALDVFVYFGAPIDITVNARPHIGTNVLPKIIAKMHEFIIAAGGEVRFDTRLDDFEIKNGKLVAIRLNNGEKIKTDRVIMATGHSSRMIFELFAKKNIAIEAKPFALGVRVEHPQELIDSIQYHCDVRSEYLPPAYYSLVSQVNQKGVYSFCMCPGGIIAPCATSPGEIVTNGWSPSKRDNPLANSGIVTEITLEDIYGITKKHHPLMAMEFQQKIEQHACALTGGKQTAPAQRLIDFTQRKVSKNLPETSYQPGITSIEMGEVLPNFVSERLRKGFVDFGKKMKGYLTNEAIIIGVETRTSSPVRIPRDKDSFFHPEVEGLLPCGEGAGYAGGIISAAIDGTKCAEKV